MATNQSAENWLSSIRSGTSPSCTIRGRIIPYMEFLCRLKNYCLFLGFREPIVQTAGPAEPEGTSAEAISGPFLPQSSGPETGNDSVVVLSTRVPYEPSWGGHIGLPRPLIHESTECRTEGTVTKYIAPYLKEYHFAQNHVYLSRDEKEQLFISLPEDLIKGGGEAGDGTLRVQLEKIVEIDEDGGYSPVNVVDTLVSFRISGAFRQHLLDNRFSWGPKKVQRIGKLLTADMFVFDQAPQPGQGNGKEKEFAQILLPAMNRIVTNSNPQLLAAIIYLKDLFFKTVDNLQGNRTRQESANLLCVAGLDIDAAAFRGEGVHYFVPWAAYLQQGGREEKGNRQLEQDDLFVALMGQEKQCPA